MRCVLGRYANSCNASCKLDYLPTRLKMLRITLQRLGEVFTPKPSSSRYDLEFSNGFVTFVELHANLSRSNRVYPSYSLIPQMRFAYLDTEERILSVTKTHLTTCYKFGASYWIRTNTSKIDHGHYHQRQRVCSIPPTRHLNLVPSKGLEPSRRSMAF